MSTHNIDFYEDLTKIIFELSSNTYLISSAEACICIKLFAACRKERGSQKSTNAVYALFICTVDVLPEVKIIKYIT